MEKSYLSLQNFFIVIAGAIFIIFGLFVLNNGNFGTVSQKSVEVGVVSLSPKGEAGGFAIPASCPSYEDTPGACNPPAASFVGVGNEGTGSPSSALTINVGESVTLTWDAAPEALSCGGLNFSTGGATEGSVVVTPLSTTSYSIICQYNASAYSPSTLSSSVGVTVLNSTLTLTAAPAQVRSGNQSMIVWSATNVDSCTTTGPGGFSQNTISGSAPSGPLTQQSVFIFTCQNAGGTLSRSATVFIIPSFEEF
ncbi:MAG: hypothetical protein Q8R36_00715 [bacterium]|nr:hypothetical protein [bacterium]